MKKNWDENIEEFPKTVCGIAQCQICVSFVLLLNRKTVRKEETICELKLFKQRVGSYIKLNSNIIPVILRKLPQSKCQKEYALWEIFFYRLH